MNCSLKVRSGGSNYAKRANMNFSVHFCAVEFIKRKKGNENVESVWSVWSVCVGGV